MALVQNFSHTLPWQPSEKQLFDSRSSACTSASDSSLSSTSASGSAQYYLHGDSRATAAGIGDDQPPCQEGLGSRAFSQALKDNSNHTAWQKFYFASAAALQQRLAQPMQKSSEETLAHQAGQVCGMLTCLAHHRINQIRLGQIQQILCGSFLFEGQKMLLWCGGLRPSDMISCTRIAMAADGIRLVPEVDTKVTAVQNAALDHQRAISRGIQDASERLARLRVMSRYVRSQGPRDACSVDLSPKVKALKDSIAQLAMQADELRLQCLEQLASLLTARQLSYYLVAPMDILQLDE